MRPRYMFLRVFFISFVQVQIEFVYKKKSKFKVE